MNASIGALIGVADPLKATSIEAVREPKNNGLQVLMVTGDDATTEEEYMTRPTILIAACQPGEHLISRSAGDADHIRRDAVLEILGPQG